MKIIVSAKKKKKGVGVGNQIKLLEPKSKITEITQRIGTKAEWRRQREESVNLETEQQNYPIWKTKNELTRGKHEQSLGDLCGYNRRSNNCGIRVPEGEE